MQKCWDVEYEKRPSFTEIVRQYHSDELVPEVCRLKEESGYVLLGPEAEKMEHREEQVDGQDEPSHSNNDSADRESLLNAILTHFQKKPQTSFVFDALLSRRGSQPAAEKADLEYYMDMTSRSLKTSVFVNQCVHDYDVVSLGEREEEELADHMTLSPEDGGHVRDNGPSLPKSNSDYILMQSAESALPPSQN